jgi:type IV pilus assembly protein PilY1
MDYSIPARIRVVDFDGDGYADRMYAGDMGGQVWRFDVTNGEPAASLINGGVIASLGGAATANLTHTRRFYNAPDAALINTRTQNFIHVGIGSGHRGHPLSTSVEDNFYALRDYGIAPRTQAEFDSLTVVGHTDLTLVNTTNNVPSTGPGWRLELDINGWNGEKVLAEARTFANQVFFSTFEPSVISTGCAPQLGTNRTYVMSVYNGAPVMNLDASSDGAITSSDLFVEARGGILPAAQALFLDLDSDRDGTPDVEDDTDQDGIPDSLDDDADGDGVPDDEEDDDGDGIPNASDDDDDNNGVRDEDEDNGGIVCVGLRCFSGVLSNDPIRTFWSQESLD